MWILPEQLEAILHEHGVRCDAAAEGSALRLGIAVEPSTGTVRLEARADGGAGGPPRDGAGASVDVDVRYGLWETHVRELLASPSWRPCAGPVAPIVSRLWEAFCGYEMLFLDAVLASSGSEVWARGGRACCDARSQCS